jgi:hypothetical protein
MLYIGMTSKLECLNRYDVVLLDLEDVHEWYQGADPIEIKSNSIFGF